MRSAVLLTGLLLVLPACGWRHDTRLPLIRDDSAPAAEMVAPGPPLRDPASDAGTTPVRLPPVATPALAGPAQAGADWQLKLEDALLVALRNSQVVRTLEGGEVSVAPVTGFDPQIARQQALVALSAFDASVGANFFWYRINQPPGSFYGPGIPENSRYDQAAFDCYLAKSWVSGTQTRIAYNPPTGYIYFPDGATGLNPTHVANLEFSVNQPLLRGFGVAVNQAPITIAQIKTDQTAWDFKQSVMAFVRSVEEAYWDLQAARVALEAADRQIPPIEEVVRVEEANLRAQRAVVADVAKARTQLYGFRQRQIEARTTVQQKEIRLRNLLNLPPCDGHVILPISEPARAPLVLDPAAVMSTALDNRPDLLRQRLSIRIRELQLVIAHNSYLPQFDVQALFRLNGIGSDLGEALQMMGEDHYNDWQLGAVFSMPIGRNAARANVRTAELQLQKERVLLDQATHEASHQLSAVILTIDSLRAEHEQADARVQESNLWLEGARIRYQNPPPAGEGQNWLLLALDDYLMAMRTTADAGTDAAVLLARYNGALARLKEAEGTLLASDEIRLLNDPAAKLRIDRLPGVRAEEIPPGAVDRNSPSAAIDLPTACPGTQPLANRPPPFAAMGGDSSFPSMAPRSPYPATADPGWQTSPYPTTCSPGPVFY